MILMLLIALEHITYVLSFNGVVHFIVYILKAVAWQQNSFGKFLYEILTILEMIKVKSVIRNNSWFKVSMVVTE